MNDSFKQRLFKLKYKAIEVEKEKISFLLSKTDMDSVFELICDGFKKVIAIMTII